MASRRGLLMKYAVPIAEALIDELIPFWASIFGEALPDMDRKVLLGAEETYSRCTLYLQREGEQLAGTCLTMHSKTMPALAGFGEVATDPQLRGRGIATELCSQAVADFRAAGGEAFFLGTVNPAAARVYHRLGWRKLAGANVMVNITAGTSPEEFLVDYFRKPGKVEIGMAGPDVRVPMIPLILTPHDSQVLDANVGLYSCRYRTQNSCMGLYPRYVRGLNQGQGAFFAARTEDGRVVGLSTALPDGAGECQVDGFVHHNFSPAWHGLIEAACTWASAQGISALRAVIAVDDGEKQALFESLGFVYEGPGADFNVDRLSKWRATI
jgi:GNAT superfamily N-acetyltransferase